MMAGLDMMSWFREIELSNIVIELIPYKGNEANPAFGPSKLKISETING